MLGKIATAELTCECGHGRISCRRHRHEASQYFRCAYLTSQRRSAGRPKPCDTWRGHLIAATAAGSVRENRNWRRTTHRCRTGRSTHTDPSPFTFTPTLTAPSLSPHPTLTFTLSLPCPARHRVTPAPFLSTRAHPSRHAASGTYSCVHAGGRCTQVHACVTECTFDSKDVRPDLI